MSDILEILNKSLPPAHVDYVRQATVGTFEAICGVEPESHFEGSCETPHQGVVGIISLVGDIIWTLMLGIPRDTATDIAMKFAGFDIPFDSQDMGDVVGELANVLGGDVVARLDDVGLKVDLSLPTVARGTDLDLLLPAGVTSTRMWFTLPEGMFWVDLALGEYHVN
jgi:CheY-specific phosphatase CheX